jgi:hypothetical protein
MLIESLKVMKGSLVPGYTSSYMSTNAHCRNDNDKEDHTASSSREKSNWF